MSDVSSVKNDLLAIEVINQRDVEFALANDAAMMMSQWTEDIVLLPPSGPIVRGRRDGPHGRQVDAHSSASAARVLEDSPGDIHR